MKIYISLPINGRPEPTFDARYAAAQRRCALIISLLRKCDEFRDAEFVHTFDLNPLGAVTEAQAMGRCIQAVIECDAIFEDYDGWTPVAAPSKPKRLCNTASVSIPPPSSAFPANDNIRHLQTKQIQL